ncbi:MFS transporter [Pseudomonas sp. NPDC096917]|uniref:MFS transporter n=1 Tax=Pseudomonas sp. NPDC096917 TaxID=3364483 RepID=UPI00383A6E7B
MALLPIAHDFAVSVEQLKWVISGYLLSVGSFMLAAGRLSDGFGHGRLLRIGLALFGLASLLCAIAPSLTALIAARALQGIGAACIMPSGLALLSHMYPSARRGRAMGLALGLGAIATVTGPFIGAALTQWFSWRFIFWINLPVVLFALGCCWRIAEQRPPGKRAAVDGLGLLLVSLGLVAFGLLLDELGRPAWAGPKTVVVTSALVLSLGLFVWREKRAATPLIDTCLFHNAPYWMLTLAGAVVNTSTVVHLFVVPLSLQSVWGLSPLQAGIAFLGSAVLLACGGPIAGRIPSSDAVRAMATCLCASAALLLGAAFAQSEWLYLLLVTLCGGFLGVANALTLIATQAVVGEHVAGVASGLTKTIITLAAGFGVILAGRSTGEMLDIQGVFTSLALCCFVASLMLWAGQRYWSGHTGQQPVDKLTGR